VSLPDILKDYSGTTIRV